MYTHRDGSLQTLTHTHSTEVISHTLFFSKLFLTPVGALRGTHTTEFCGEVHNSPSFFALDDRVRSRYAGRFLTKTTDRRPFVPRWSASTPPAVARRFDRFDGRSIDRGAKKEGE